ncbi:MAG: hypothetical protein KME21_26785 [Desmonostoc vinosum HA7617-LM4]|jgi:hypothetical protein|nr:hypothetical protein [Desmonostoc vinosum HA7617-LM4]
MQKFKAIAEFFGLLTVVGGCRSNVMFRFGLMRSEFKISNLRKDESVYQSFEEFLSLVSY